MANYQIMLPEKVYFGEGCLDNLGNEATRLAARHALIVTDPGVSQAGLAGPVKTQLARAGLSVDVFADAEPEPTLPRLNAIAAGHRKSSYDLLVGIGGGSSMDTAKGLSVLLAHGGDGDKYLGVDKVPGPCIPVFAVPTTAGTGSEVTRNAIFGIPEKEVKLAIVSPYILPRIAFVDPSLTYTCPPKVTAATGMDALVHAIECYTSLRANNFTDAVALEAMRLIVANLRTAVKNGSDKEAR